VRHNSPHVPRQPNEDQHSRAINVPLDRAAHGRSRPQLTLTMRRNTSRTASPRQFPS
jgi:hypothetical protein